jgi:hypothetical protein
MLVIDVYKIPALVSLAVIIAILSVAVAGSVLVQRRRTAVEPHALTEPAPGG